MSIGVNAITPVLAPRADPGPQRQRIDWRLAASFAITTLIWGSTWLVIKDQLSVVPPSWSVTYRFVIGGAAMLVLCLAMGKSLNIGRAGHAFALAVGTLQFAINFNFVYRAEQHLASGLVALVFTLMVGTNALLGWVVLRQKVTPLFLIGSAMGVGGVALLVGDVSGGSNPGLGALLAVSAVASASCANVLQATPAGRRLPLEPALALAMVYGAVINAGVALVTSGPPVFDPRPLYWIGTAYLGLVASAFAFLVYYAMIRRIGAARAGYVNVLVPVVAMTLSTLFEGYRWTGAAAAGGVLALAGLVVALRSRA